MANFFDQFDEAPKAGNFFDQFDAKPKEESGMLRQIADVPLGIGKGVLTGVRMVADAFGAGSGASEAIKGAEGYVSSLMSAQAKNDEQEIARIMKDAEDKGMLDQVQAAFKAFSVAPVDLLAQGVGTAGVGILSMLGGKVLGAGRLGLGAIGAATGAGMGAGAAKGGIYEEVKAALKESGIDESRAEQAAIQAQEYGGKNLDQILLSAGLGAVTGGTGVESVARSILTRAATKEAGKQAARGALREAAEGAAKTAATEGLPEYLQGSQEQLAKNIALQREGLDVPTMRGVVGSGVLEGLAGAGLGAIAGGTEAGLRRQARDEAQRILAEEERARSEAEAARLAAEEAEKAKTPPLALGGEGAFTPVVLPDGSVAMTREDLAQYEEAQFQKKYAPQPGEAPYAAAPSLTGTDMASRLAQRPGEGGMAEMLAARRQEQEDAQIEEARRAREVFPPSEDAGRSVLRTDRDAGLRGILAERRTAEEEAAAKEAARLARVESQQAKRQAALLGEIESPLMAAARERAEQEKREAEAKAARDAAEEAKRLKESLKPTTSITGGISPAALTGAPAGGDLASIISGKREAEAAKAEVPLADDYTFLQREKQRLLKQDQTPDTKKLLARIDERIGEVLARDIERQRADAEAAKTSVFAQKELPPVESRDVVVGGEELAKLQAREAAPEAPLTKKEITSIEKMRGQPAPTESEAEEQIAKLERERTRIKSTNLYGELMGKLAPGEVSDISPDVGKNLRIKGGRGGAFISDIVSSGSLDNYLPPDMRPGSITFDETEATEYIKDKLRNKNTLTFDAEIESRKLDEQIDQLRKEVEAPRQVEYEIAEATEEARADRDIRYQRSESTAPSIGVDRTLEVVNATKSKWANAPQVVVAENMDDPVIPKAVREHNKAAIAKGAKGKPKGFFYKGKAYILADAMSSDQDVIETLFHESLGHYGLRGTFGPEMGKVLADVVKNRRTEVETKAEQYGLDPKNPDDMLEAAEEVLAVMAQTKPGLPFVKRAIAVIRNFLRDLGFNIKLSDNDIIQKYILPARAFVERGERRAVEGKPAAMREPAKAPPTDSAAFKKWFGNSKVVDAEGNPLVVYHASTSPIDEFKPKNYGTAGDHSYFYFAASESWSKKFAKDSLGVDKPSMHKVYLSIKNPLDLRGESRTPGGWIDFFDGIGVGVSDKLRSKLNAAPAKQEIAAWQLLRFDTPQNGAMRERLIDSGYDGIIMSDVVRGKTDNTTFVSFNPTQIKSATGNIGTYDPENADIRYSRDSITGKPILSQWTTPTDTKIAGEIGKDDIIYSLQNKMIDTKRVVDAITATAGKIAAKWNPYLQEELYHGRTAKQTKDFLTEELRPLMQAMEKDGVSIADMEEYLKNRHAIAYNAQVAKVNPSMPDKGSGIATADAQKYLSSLSPADKAKYDALAKRVDSITKGTRKLLVDSGLETQETIDNWEKTFPFYVPLKRGDIDYAYTAGGMGTGQGFDVRGDFSRRAMGSEREATDVLANVAMMRERAIVKAQKNRVAQALFGLAAQNPNPEFWLPVDPLAEVDPANMQELLNFGLSQQDLDFIAKEPRQKAIDKNKNEVVERINATLRNNKNVLSMRFNGENRYVFFNPNDPRAKRMAESLKNLDADQLGGILEPISTITRWMAAVNTQYNPIFGAYNFLRDVQGAALQLSDTPLAKDRKAVIGGTLPALKGIYAAMRAERDGKQAKGEWSELWEEFQKEGGQTGFRDQFSRSQERAEALQKELNKMREGKLKTLGRAGFDWLSDYNDSMENAVRLSAYKAALDKGIGKEEAASIAKNLTVNFNRKGQIAVQAGALYAFFNAAMQGTTRLIQTLKGPAGKKIIAGGLLLGTMQAALLAAYGYDEEEPPEFVRERNLILPLEIFGIEDKYLAFPMPLGYHVIPGVSRIITEWALSGFKDTPERIASMTGMFLEAFNPIGNAGWSAQTLAPTFADPIVALTENRDWTGKPIARKDFSNLDPTPGYTRAKDTASLFSTQIAKFLNYASGGTEFKPGVLSPTPDQIDYLVGQATGGLGREALKVEQTVTKTFTGEELPPYKIPLVGRFYGETKSSAAESSRFYKNMTELNEHENEIKGRRENRQPIGDYFQENPEARLAPMARKTYADIQKLRKRREMLVERDAPRESVKAVENQITAKMRMLNERVEALSK